GKTVDVSGQQIGIKLLGQHVRQRQKLVDVGPGGGRRQAAEFGEAAQHFDKVARSARGDDVGRLALVEEDEADVVAVCEGGLCHGGADFDQAGQGVVHRRAEPYGL